MSKAKEKGTFFESLIVEALCRAGWSYAERRSLNGAVDKGDITGVPGVVIEAKNHGTLKLGPWIQEAAIEKANANAEVGVVWAKRKGKGSADDAYVIMTGTEFMFLLKKAGY
tara:strand:- start:293 stop:628 length:336 start_codon:yes stop_codon:yes gene_type:complete